MSLIKTSTGIALALAAATTLSACSGTPSTSSGAIATADKNSAHCHGVNKCKGHNDCKTAGNSCKGHASCKGQGFVKMSAKACGDVGGTVK
ncbi:MAG: hypothetical protein V3U71_07820 [Cocleimonas sp.]